MEGMNFVGVEEVDFAEEKIYFVVAEGRVHFALVEDTVNFAAVVGEGVNFVDMELDFVD